MSAFEALSRDLAADDPLLAAALVNDPTGEGEAPVALAIGPGTERAASDYSYGLEAIREGHLLHWGSARFLSTDDDDLALLAGDRLYAAGLERIAALGDAQTIAELSGLIMAAATARAEGLPAAAEAVWDASCARIGAGS
ncbi:MAG: hypothetical protein F2799_05715 [Actinobacteria bacterium]|uniref:Unannotated protein n=1 Tax=freshwater metagenome TaxID=449393 RepID=A0A6J7EAU3_9ZZZZ|nr:hypothetical protein [Actinomycetota bacterium]